MSVVLQGERWSGNWNMQYIGEADEIEVAAGVDNLLDEDAPFVASWIDANTDTMTYDLMGQRWYLKFNWNSQ